MATLINIIGFAVFFGATLSVPLLIMAFISHNQNKAAQSIY